MREPVKTFRQMLLAGAALAAMLPAGAASAQEGVFMKDLLGSLGFIEKDREEIIYRERPPLVVPPSATLPAPVAPAEQRTAAWPKDPDIEAKRRAAEAARAPRGTAGPQHPSQGGRLSVDEIRQGRRITDTRADPTVADMNRNNPYMNPELLRQSKQTEAENLLAYGAEPQRRYLTDPPRGLRLPASTAPLPKVLAQEAPAKDLNESNEKEYAAGIRN